METVLKIFFQFLGNFWKCSNFNKFKKLSWTTEIFNPFKIISQLLWPRRTHIYQKSKIQSPYWATFVSYCWFLNLLTQKFANFQNFQKNRPKTSLEVFTTEMELLLTFISEIIIVDKFSSFPHFFSFSLTIYTFFYNLLKKYWEMNLVHQFQMIKCNISISPLVTEFSGVLKNFFVFSRMFFIYKNYFSVTFVHSRSVFIACTLFKGFSKRIPKHKNTVQMVQKKRKIKTRI